MEVMQMCCRIECENKAWKGVSDYCKDHFMAVRPDEDSNREDFNRYGASVSKKLVRLRKELT